jgi:hypothetical protein
MRNLYWRSHPYVLQSNLILPVTSVTTAIIRLHLLLLLLLSLLYVALFFNNFFCPVHYGYTYVSEQLKFYISRKRRCRLCEPFLIEIYLGSKIGPFLWKLSGFVSLLCVSENLPCSVSAFLVKIIFMLLGLHQQMFLGTLMNLRRETVSFHHIFSFHFLVINY